MPGARAHVAIDATTARIRSDRGPVADRRRLLRRGLLRLLLLLAQRLIGGARLTLLLLFVRHLAP